MKSGKCPKCGSQDIRFQQGMSKRDDLRLSAFSGIALCDYICGQCGYVESYVRPEDLKKVRDLLPLATVETVEGEQEGSGGG
jgi:predicted nucleic-acid-binding Zn-ribbon protein